MTKISESEIILIEKDNVMADLQRNRFEPERVPNAEDSGSENYWLEGTFWCTCERCKTMPTQRESVCCREHPESENKMEGIILSLYCIGRSKWKNNFLCKLPWIVKGGLIKPKAVIFYLSCLYFHFTSWRCHEGISRITANKEFSMVCLN